MIKKLLSLLLVLSLAGSCFINANAEFVYNPIDFEGYFKNDPLVTMVDDEPYPVGYDENSGSKSTDEAPEAYKKLYAEGIADNISSKDGITRSEFVSMAMRAIGLRDVLQNGRNVFFDVDESRSDAFFINAAYDLNIISGNGGIFSPDEFITYADAAVIAVKILGRNDEAKALGGYPYGYERAARQRGLFDGIDISADYDKKGGRDELYAILQNTVECTQFAKIEGYSGKEAVYKSEKNTNMLGFYLDIYSYSGVVSSVGISGIYSQNYKNMNTVCVGNAAFDGKYDDYINYLGMYADILYKENSSSNEIIYMDCGDYNTAAAIDAKDVLSHTKSGYEYDKDGKKKTARVALNASYIYNGRLLASNDEKYYIPENGHIIFIDNDKDGSYDVVIIKSYRDITVGDVDIDNAVIYGDYESGEKVSFEQDDDIAVSLKDSAGKNLYFGMVKAGNILTVYESIDGTVITGIVSNKTVSGKIDAVSKNDGDTAIEIDKTVYNVSENCEKRCKSLISAGENVTLRLNIYGIACDIIPFKNADNAFKTAYVIDRWDETDSPSSKIIIKLITQDNEIKKYKINDKCTIDGSVLKTKSEQNTALDNGKAQGNVILFKEDENGEITRIDTALFNLGKEDELSTLRKIYSPSEETLRFKSESYGGGFGEKFFWKKTESVVFVINSAESEDKRKYRVASASYPFSNDNYYAPEAYRTGDSFYADILVSYLTSAENDVSDKTMWIVEDIRTVSQDGEEKIGLSLNSGTAKKKIMLDKDVFDKKDIEAGDIIRCDLYDDEVIGSGIIKTYDCSRDAITEEISQYPFAQFFLRRSFVYDKKDDVLLLCTVKNADDIESAKAEDFKYAKLRAEVYSVDKDNKGNISVKSVSYADIMTYLSSGKDCSKVIGYWKYMVLQKIYILNY